MSPKPIGERYTEQRDVIFQVIRNAKGPLMVSEIHDLARERLLNLGIATVYRTIKLLLATDRIKGVVLPDGQTRYEASGMDHHHHFRCTSCDKVFDIDVCPINIPKGTSFPGGFYVDDHEVTLYGRCADCYEKSK